MLNALLIQLNERFRGEKKVMSDQFRPGGELPADRINNHPLIPPTPTRQSKKPFFTTGDLRADRKILPPGENPWMDEMVMILRMEREARRRGMVPPFLRKESVGGICEKNKKGDVGVVR